MKYAADLHIHSCLSPCSEDDMTPNNIINMALIKGLDIIAVTDHNSGKNVESVIEAAKNRILVVPGIEVESKEEVHLLTYFRKLNDLKSFNHIISQNLPKIEIDTKIWGNQIVMDSKDRKTGLVDNLLTTSTTLSLEEIFSIVRSLDGVVVPAHVDRGSYSIISNLGFIPENLKVKTVEIMKKDSLKHPSIKHLNYIISSDAHFLGNILERIFFLDLKKLTIDEVIDNLIG
ncbi:MAG: PHP domain-containing protein [Clostridium sp.]|nr:PHP domain-containing protein [Clostridium sp.]